jgi:hypothetical protein
MIKTRGWALGLVIILPLTFGCSPNKSDTASKKVAEKDAPFPAEPENNFNGSCPQPAVFSPRFLGGSLKLDQLKTQLTGAFELSEFHVYSFKALDDISNFAFYVKYEASSEILPHASVVCHDSPVQVMGDAGFISTVPLARLVHFPSGRITTFDQNSGIYDDPNYNIPSITLFNFDSKGAFRYPENAKELIGAPPFLKNRYLEEFLKNQFVSSDLYLTGTESFEIHFAKEETNGAISKTVVKYKLLQ